MVLIEPERPRERFENLRRGIAVATPLESQVVVGADPRQQSELLAPQPGHTPDAVPGQAHLLGSHALAAGAQVAPERVGALPFERRPASTGGCQGEV